jgi:hypothetical protein
MESPRRALMDPLVVMSLALSSLALIWAGLMLILYGVRLYLYSRGNYVLEDWF